MTTKEQTALADAARALDTAARELADASAHEDAARDAFDTTGSAATREVLLRATLTRERCERLHTKAAAAADTARTALAAAERAADEAKLADLLETLRPASVAAAQREAWPRILDLYRQLAGAVADLREIVADQQQAHRAARTLAAKLGDTTIAAVEAPTLDDAAFALGIVLAEVCAAESLDPAVADVVQTTTRPPWGDQERPRYDAAVRVLRAIGAIHEADEGETAHVQ